MGKARGYRLPTLPLLGANQGSRCSAHPTFRPSPRGTRQLEGRELRTQPTPSPNNSPLETDSTWPESVARTPVEGPDARDSTDAPADIAPFYVMELLRQAELLDAELARDSQPGVIHLEVGQPSTGAPRAVVAAAHRALDQERLGYTNALGIEPLRQAISAHYRDRLDTTVPSNRIAITSGASGGFLTAFLACFRPGDMVLLPEPGYPCYRNLLMQMGAQPAAIRLDEQTDFRLTADAVEGALVRARRADPSGRGARGLVVATPANPTGTAIDRAELAAIHQTCASFGAVLIVDEIYQGLSYGDAPHSVLAGLGAGSGAALDNADDVIVINSFSKYFSMTGWRLGWMVLPERRVEPVERLLQNLFICAPALSQHAALAAFDAAVELEAHVERYRENRRLWMEALGRMDLPVAAAPDGAFYLWVDVRSLTEDSQDLAQRLLNEAHLALTPGIDFDTARGHQFLRVSYSGSTEDTVEGCRRLTNWVVRHR